MTGGCFSGNEWLIPNPVPDKINPQEFDYARRHLSFGWYSFLVFTALGLGLESLHGFKVQAYLDLSNETRRLMWTLAHAHGTLLSLVNVLFALTLRLFPESSALRARAVSNCLILATLLIPGGFFLGGFFFYGGDPGIGVLIVPIGAALLLAAIYMMIPNTSGSKPSKGQTR